MGKSHVKHQLVQRVEIDASAPSYGSRGSGLSRPGSYVDEDSIFLQSRIHETWATSVAIAGILFAATMLSL